MSAIYVPVRKKNQIIIAAGDDGKYVIPDNDRKILLRVIKDKDKVQRAISKIESDELNPQRITCIKVSLKVFLYFMFFVFFLLFFYAWIGIFLFFLGDPVICFIYGYFMMYQVWWRGGRISIELIVEYRKSKPMEHYLSQLNRQVGDKRIQFTLGGGGKWIQIDINK